MSRSTACVLRSCRSTGPCGTAAARPARSSSACSAGMVPTDARLAQAARLVAILDGAGARQPRPGPAGPRGRGTPSAPTLERSADLPGRDAAIRGRPQMARRHGHDTDSDQRPRRPRDARRGAASARARRAADDGGRLPVDGIDHPVTPAPVRRAGLTDDRARAARRPVRDRRGARRRERAGDRPRHRSSARSSTPASTTPTSGASRARSSSSTRSASRRSAPACGSTPRRCAPRCCTTPSRTPRRSLEDVAARRSARRSPRSSTASRSSPA